MSSPRPPEPVKFFVSIISSQNNLIIQASKILLEHLGRIDFISEAFPFNYTKYYEKEMGKDLFRKFLFFGEIASPEKISTLKGITDQVEKKFLSASGRMVNIDPGYLNHYQVVLVTNKNYSHRLYLKNGVYAEITLIYREGEYHPLSWTYPDYSSLEIRGLFQKLRERYLQQRRDWLYLRRGEKESF